jgi:hypothetical protein
LGLGFCAFSFGLRPCSALRRISSSSAHDAGCAMAAATERVGASL